MTQQMTSHKVHPNVSEPQNAMEDVLMINEVVITDNIISSNNFVY